MRWRRFAPHNHSLPRAGAPAAFPESWRGYRERLNVLRFSCERLLATFRHFPSASQVQLLGSKTFEKTI
jgi:hypothetical protein